MKSDNLIPLLLAGIVAGGCAVGPDYHRPPAGAASHWAEPLAGGETNGALPAASWWKSFNDPELDSLIARAMVSNHDLQIAQARVLEARAQSRIATSKLWPTVNASASYSQVQTSQREPVIGSIPLSQDIPFNNDYYQAGFDAAWELDVFGGKRRGVEAAKAQVGASEYGRRAVVLTLLGDVARNYLDVRAYQRRLEIARENIKAQADGLAITRNRFTNGLSSDLDVQQAASLLAITEAEVPSLETALQASLHRLDVLLGFKPGALQAELESVKPIPATPPVVPVGLPSELLLRRPDIQMAERDLAAATANIGVATADLYPKFALTGVGGFESISASDWFTGVSKYWTVGPTVQWRIFDAGRIRANIKIQNARQEQALAAYEQTVLRAFEDVENALVAYAKSQVRRKSLAEAVAASQKSLQLANQLYSNGLTDFLNVLEAERSLYQTQDQLAQSDRAVSANLVSLYKALGGGWQAFDPRPAGQVAQNASQK
jgi:NodT family efflux transporter outer membrane factor (OMF) lipoprotein